MTCLEFEFQKGLIQSCTLKAVTISSWLKLAGFDSVVMHTLGKLMKTSKDMDLKRLAESLVMLERSEEEWGRANLYNRISGFNLPSLEISDREMFVRRNSVFKRCLAGFAPIVSSTPNSSLNSSTSGIIDLSSDNSNNNEDDREYVREKKLELDNHCQKLRDKYRKPNTSAKFSFDWNEQTRYDVTKYQIVSIDKIEPQNLPDITCIACRRAKPMERHLVRDKNSDNYGRLMYRCNNSSCRSRDGALLYASDVFGSKVQVRRILF
jgi:hypothetical protein